MRRYTSFLCPLCVLACAAAQALAGDEPPAKSKPRPDIYDRKADGNKQIAAALRAAQRDHRRVLLQFGANWCGWCHKLHDLFESNKDIHKTLVYEYDVVLIDVDKVDGRMHNADVDAKYGNPTKLGLPVLVVLDENGKPLVTQDTGKLEDGDHHDPQRVLEFLKKWQATAPPAEETLKAGLARAKAESKRVFLHFGAPWCPWCRKLDAYLWRDEIARVLGAAYVDVKIDVDRMAGGKELDQRYRPKGDRGGIPFFVILDADGNRLADSFTGPDGNIGYPAEPQEVAHFVNVLRQTAPKLSDADIDILKAGLKK